MKNPRPVFLDLLHIRQPLPALISIAHRLSGVLLFLAIPFVLNIWQASLASEASFRALQDSLGLKLALLFLGMAYAYHFFAGLRFLLLDLHWGLSLEAARLSSWAVLATSLACALLLGIWLC
jgi:succinate dehydrogenase / fumarate reductase cytochrome b subunit